MSSASFSKVLTENKSQMLASVNYRKPKDFFGRSVDELKSMFQKGVRLGEKMEALSGFFACYNLRALFPEEKAALAIQTNIINRLIICICEDVCYANPALVRDTLPQLVVMSQKPETRNPQFLADVIQTVTESKKSRWCSHAAAFYFPSEPAETLDFASPTCFTWLETKWPEVEARIKTLGLAREFFKMLLSYHKRCAEKNKKTMKRFILGLAHFLKVDSEQGRYFRSEWSRKARTELASVDITPYLAHDKSVYPEVPDYAIDMHTSKGRSLKRDAKRFRAVGARVENEHELMKNTEYEAVYLNL